MRSRLGGRRLRSVDLFAGSGFLARLMKKHSSLVVSNDLELYAQAIGECFLADHDEAFLMRLGGTPNASIVPLSMDHLTTASSEKSTRLQTIEISRSTSGYSIPMIMHAVWIFISKN